jgi:hypothetical protein
MWFGQILAAAAIGYGVQLLLTTQTQWVNIAGDLQSEIADPAQWRGLATELGCRLLLHSLDPLRTLVVSA